MANASWSSVEQYTLIVEGYLLEARAYVNDKIEERMVRVLSPSSRRNAQSARLWITSSLTRRGRRTPSTASTGQRKNSTDCR